MGVFEGLFKDDGLPGKLEEPAPWDDVALARHLMFLRMVEYQ